jgi:hypothetical protein
VCIENKSRLNVGDSFRSALERTGFNPNEDATPGVPHNYNYPHMFIERGARIVCTPDIIKRMGKHPKWDVRPLNGNKIVVALKP